MKSESFGEMCEVSCVQASIAVKGGGEVERRRKLFWNGVGMGV